MSPNLRKTKIIVFSPFFSFHYRIVGCSHQRAWEYFIESINRPSSFLATRCEPNTMETTNKKDINCDNHVPAHMGFNADKRWFTVFKLVYIFLKKIIFICILYRMLRLRGKFYLTTNSERPFSKSWELWICGLNVCVTSFLPVILPLSSDTQHTHTLRPNTSSFNSLQYIHHIHFDHFNWKQIFSFREIIAMNFHHCHAFDV